MPDKCPHCGLIHETTCPRIRAIEYHPNGAVKRVEFHDYAVPPALLFGWRNPAPHASPPRSPGYCGNFTVDGDGNRLID